MQEISYTGDGVLDAKWGTALQPMNSQQQGEKRGNHVFLSSAWGCPMVAGPAAESHCAGHRENTVTAGEASRSWTLPQVFPSSCTYPHLSPHYLSWHITVPKGRSQMIWGSGNQTEVTVSQPSSDLSMLKKKSQNTESSAYLILGKIWF